MKHSVNYPLKRDIKFKDCCTKRTKLLGKVLKLNCKLYENWLDFLVNEYTNAAIEGQCGNQIENSTIASLILEAVDCLDGINITLPRCY